MQSAFIDIGLERAAFLHVADIWEARPHDGAAPPTHRKILFDGQVLTVQVIKDPIGTKGARLSTQISIAGRMLVYLPQDKHIGISQKIEKEAEREALRARLQSLLPPDEKGGYIVRTMAEDASDADLAADIEYLRKTWARSARRAHRRPPACCTRT
jgi:ribonuclease G